MTIQYFVTDRRGSYIEFDSQIGSLSLAGQKAIIIGNTGSDWVYVGAGNNVDATGLGIGIDHIYLTGNFDEYEQTVVGNTYTLRRDVEVNGDTQKEEVKFTAQKEANRVYFADGSLTIDETTLYDTSQFSYKPITADLLDTSETTPASPSEISNPYIGSEPLLVYIDNAAGEHVPGVRPGTELRVFGNTGGDSVYVTAGSNVDVTGLGLGVDDIYLTGNFNDYEQTVVANTYTLTRTVGENTETVRFNSQGHTDRLFFADGYVEINNDILTVDFENREILATDLDPTLTTPIVPTQTVTITEVTDDSDATLTDGVSADVSKPVIFSGTLSANLNTGEVLAAYDGTTRLGEAKVTDTAWTFDFVVPITPTWSDKENVSISGDNIKKDSDAEDGWNAGFYSNEVLTDYGSVSFTVGAHANIMIGLSAGSNDEKTNNKWNSIDYAIYLSASGGVTVYENGSLKNYSSGYTSTDEFSIARDGETITYLENGEVFYTSTIKSTGDLHVDGSLWSANAEINDISLALPPSSGSHDIRFRVENELTDLNGSLSESSNVLLNQVTIEVTDDVGDVTGTLASGVSTDDLAPRITGTLAIALAEDEVLAVYDGATRIGEAVVTETEWTLAFDITPTWTSKGDVSVIGNDVSKNNADGWNAGVYSNEALTGDGSVSFRAGEHANKAIGLSAGSDNKDSNNVNSIDYAIKFHSDGRFAVRENGQALSDNVDASGYHDYEAGDIFSIARDGTTITYLKNGVEFHESGIESSGDLHVDALIYTSDSGINDISLNDSEALLNDSEPLHLSALSPGSHDLSFKIENETKGLSGPELETFHLLLNQVSITEVSDDVGHVTGSVAPDNASDDRTPTLSGTLSAALAEDESVKIYDGTTELGSAVITDLTWSFTPTTALAFGAHDFTAAIVADNNALVTSTAYGITIDAATQNSERSAEVRYESSIFAVANVAEQEIKLLAITDNEGLLQGNVLEQVFNEGEFSVSGTTATDDTSLSYTGTLALALAAGESMKVYHADELLGTATVDGTDWSFIAANDLSYASHEIRFQIETDAGEVQSSTSVNVNVLTEDPALALLRSNSEVAIGGIERILDLTLVGGLNQANQGAVQTFNLDNIAGISSGEGTNKLILDVNDVLLSDLISEERHQLKIDGDSGTVEVKVKGSDDSEWVAAGSISDAGNDYLVYNFGSTAQLLIDTDLTRLGAVL